ncbi:unnamed protein product [Leptidea sinapis]|uniref:Prothoracicotropic hormone n=1 Tax=Leptidea sinapis TaxID=189913 RepID=A0A5E4QDW2_9NEOP|nr:unnamed protein product [Leptidea sinapis]
MWLPITALKKTSNIDEYTVENQRTHMRQNYVVQRRSDEDQDRDSKAVMYPPETFPPNSNPEELPAVIVDYANMIRNDIILLDNSVETRTRKRGNIKVEKYNTYRAATELLYLGEDFIPSSIETRRCQRDRCSFPFVCHRRLYNITLLKRNYTNEYSSEELPPEIARKWVAIQKPITIACFCSKNKREKF